MSLMDAWIFWSVRSLQKDATIRVCMNFLACATLKKYLLAVLLPRVSCPLFLSNITLLSALMGISMLGFSFLFMSSRIFLPSLDSSSEVFILHHYRFLLFLPPRFLFLFLQIPSALPYPIPCS